MPTDTNNFTPLSAGVSTVAPINVALGELSHAITQLQGGGASSGILSIAVVAGESLAARDAAYIDPDDGLLYAIDADAAPAAAGAIRGFVSAAVSISATATLIVTGILAGFTGLTPNLPVYADTTGAGTITQSRPEPALDSGQLAIVPMGMAISATQIDVMASFMDNRIRYQARYSPAQNETITVQHQKHINALGRHYAAYVTQANTLTEYGSANQDTDVNLKDRVISTYTSDLCTGGTPIGDMTDNDGVAGAFDDDDSTKASKSSSTTGTIGYDFGASNDQTIRRYTITEATTGNETAAPKDWTFEYSDNGSDWTVIDTVTSETGWGDGETRTFDIDTAVSARYWRLNISDNNGSSNTHVGELEMMEVATYTDGVDKLGQGIQAAGGVFKVNLWLKKVGSPTGNLTVTIETDNAGDPSGTAVTNGTSNNVAASSLSTGYGWIEFTFATSPTLSASTQYHLVLETTESHDEFDYVVWGADGSAPSYANGEMKSESSAVWSSESADACFQVLAEGLKYIKPVLVDEYASAFASMGAQAGDTGGADVDTKTTFKCLLAAGYGDITVEVVI